MKKMSYSLFVAQAQKSPYNLTWSHHDRVFREFSRHDVTWCYHYVHAVSSCRNKWKCNLLHMWIVKNYWRLCAFRCKATHMHTPSLWGIYYGTFFQPESINIFSYFSTKTCMGTHLKFIQISTHHKYFVEKKEIYSDTPSYYTFQYPLDLDSCLTAVNFRRIAVYYAFQYPLDLDSCLTAVNFRSSAAYYAFQYPLDLDSCLTAVNFRSIATYYAFQYPLDLDSCLTAVNFRSIAAYYAFQYPLDLDSCLTAVNFRSIAAYYAFQYPLDLDSCLTAVNFRSTATYFDQKPSTKTSN